MPNPKGSVIHIRKKIIDKIDKSAALKQIFL